MLKVKKKSLYNKRNRRKKVFVDALVLVMFAITVFSQEISRRNNYNFNGENEISSKTTSSGYNEKINIRSVADNLPRNGKYKVKNKESIIDVPYIDQTDYYPTGCEVVSATMVMQYYGYNIYVDEMVGEYLDMSTIELKDGVLWGEDPNKYFIGDPRSIYSYGCYAPVIVKAMNKILDDGEIAKDLTGTSLKDLTGKYIDKKIPVLIWATIEMEPTSEGTDWLLKSNGLRFHWIGGEHCLVLVGYDDNSYYFNDPYENNGVVAYNKDIVEMRYEELGKQSIAIDN